MTPRCYADYRQAARARLPGFLFEYVDAGSYAETTLARNESDLADVMLRQRVLRDVASIDPATSLFGRRWTMPVALAPVGMAGMMARRGEVQAARAAEQAGVPFCLSSAACCPIEEVAAGAHPELWYQLYMLRDRGYMRALLARARAAGFRALVVTLDTPRLGVRYRDFRAGISTDPWPVRTARMAAQLLPRMHWAWHVGIRGRPHTLGNMAAAVEGRPRLADIMAWMQSNLESSLTWPDIEWFRAHWDGPLILKGILDREDARLAAAAGVEGIILSNHGGRQLDGAPSTAMALPRVAEAVGQQLAVLVDGGVRSGLDVVRMLALGARAVLIGRPWAFALGARGETGVRHLLDLMREEILVAMALAGVTRVADIDAGVLAPRHNGRN